ncbi:MAG: PIN domain-containing protein [Verrucomicrobiota bacterium]
MVIAVDTSFLFSLFGNDQNTVKAVGWLKGCDDFLQVTVLNLFELENAFHLAAFKDFYSPDHIHRFKTCYEAALANGHLVLMPVDLHEVIQRARHLSQEYSTRGGHRSFDVLHIAAGASLGAGTFLTFDNNQIKLAQAVGLECPLY